MPFIKPTKQTSEFTQTVQYLRDNHAVTGYKLTRADLYPDNQYGDYNKLNAFSDALTKLANMGVLVKEKGSYRVTEESERWLWGIGDI